MAKRFCDIAGRLRRSARLCRLILQLSDQVCVMAAQVRTSGPLATCSKIKRMLTESSSSIWSLLASEIQCTCYILIIQTANILCCNIPADRKRTYDATLKLDTAPQRHEWSETLETVPTLDVTSRPEHLPYRPTSPAQKTKCKVSLNTVGQWIHWSSRCDKSLTTDSQ